MVAIIPELDWRTLTAAVNEVLPSSTFLRNLMFPPRTEVQLTTETVMYGSISGGRDMAPMVHKNGQSIMVAGVGESEAVITAPNIRISRPLTPSQLYFQRRAGTELFPSAAQQASAAQATIARDLDAILRSIENREEWMAAMALRGTIEYSVADQESFTITYPRNGANTITLTGTDVWSNAASDPESDFLDAMLAVSETTGVILTDAIMSRTAYDAFRRNAKVIEMLDKKSINIGSLTASVIQASGAIYGGTFANIRIWCYPRVLTDHDGTSVPLIRDKYVEFVSDNPATDNALYYAAIPDLDAADQGTIAVKRFAKSWTKPDPSVRMALVHTRPLPVVRRPNTTVSMKVLA